MTSSHTTVRTRFAPSPTGFLHLGGARTALFSWAYAKHHQGKFVLRIEDTDVERSTPEAVQAILDGMAWLGLDVDEGPFYQMQRHAEHKQAIQQLLDSGHAYYCYSSPEEVQQMREQAKAQGLKPRYDGTWRPEPGKTLPPIPEGRQPVVRFKNPTSGAVNWDDLVKGPISVANHELDDLIIARSDGTPTYNFSVVIDDRDMEITHVIRGDDHVNNTPRQINILQALGAKIPVYGHVPMILGPDGEKLSKRHGAVSVTEYDKAGYLPEAMVNYLARLGWSHGDEELFSIAELIAWFDGSHLSRSPAQWDPKKLNWVNAHYIKQSSPADLSQKIIPRVQALGGNTDAVDMLAIIELLQPRAETLETLAQEAMLFCGPKQEAAPEALEKALTEQPQRLLTDFKKQAETLDTWTAPKINEIIQSTLKQHQAKMPHIGIPLRLVVTGQRQTPAIDAVLAILGKQTVLQRLENF